jgi:hypothetical protein
MAAQKVARGIGSVNLKTICIATVSRYEPDIVEHSTCVEKFGVELEATAPAGECAKIVDAAGVIEQQSRFGIADEFCDLVGKFTVGNRAA